MSVVIDFSALDVLTAHPCGIHPNNGDHAPTQIKDTCVAVCGFIWGVRAEELANEFRVGSEGLDQCLATSGGG
jgi:hypothetical protein